MKNFLTALFLALPVTSMVSAAWCFLKLMFYTNLPEWVEPVFYLSAGNLLVYVVMFILLWDEYDDEY